MLTTHPIVAHLHRRGLVEFNHFRERTQRANGASVIVHSCAALSSVGSALLVALITTLCKLWLGISDFRFLNNAPQVLTSHSIGVHLKPNAALLDNITLQKICSSVCPGRL
jgi:hypothetical protein